MEKLMRTGDSIPQAKVARTLFRQSKVRPQAVFGQIILAGGSGISPKNPALPGCGPLYACGIKSPVPHHKP